MKGLDGEDQNLELGRVEKGDAVEIFEEWSDRQGRKEYVPRKA